MAAQRMFNSTIPFKELKGNLGEEVGIGGEEQKKGTLVSEITPLLRVLLTQGTAKQVGAEDKGKEELLCISIIAQAECEGAQEFSPTITEHNFIRSYWTTKDRGHGVTHDSVSRLAPLLADRAGPMGALGLRSPRKRRKRQRRRRRRELEEEEQEQGTSSVPEQESSSSIRQTHTQECLTSSYRYKSSQNSGVQETESLVVAEKRLTDSHCTAFPLNILSRESHLWGPGSISHCSEDSGSDSLASILGECEIALKALQNTVSQEDPCFVYPFFKKLAAEAAEEDYEGNTDINEGLLFHPEEKLKPKNYEFREGREFSLLRHIQSGSYGDVYSVRDNGTGFRCAAKKIPLRKFNSEEVGSWSALNSPRVLQFYGAVREGPDVILFMDLKPGSLGQLLRQRGRLPEDLALRYHSQVLEALEYLHRKRVLHLDVKVDNVLLSEDLRDTFLCDFGHSERLGPDGRSTKAKHGQAICGTETHMAPEVAKGDRRCAKADVWSSCCMLLHMLNGCPPWTRFYSRPLCLKIASEPPPLREVPSSCNQYTVDVFNSGLQKDPIKRPSAAELLVKVGKALKEVGGFKSSIAGVSQEPACMDGSPSTVSRSSPSLLASYSPMCNSLSSITSSLDRSSEEALEWVSAWRETAQEEDSEYEDDEQEVLEDEDDRERESSECLSPEPGLRLPVCQFRSQQAVQFDSSFTVSEQELQKLSRDLILGSLSQPHPPELQEHLLSCLSSDCSSQRDPGDKDSGRWSGSVREDLSSGVFSSYSSQTDGRSFNVDWLGSTPCPSTRCFEGVDVWIENFDGQCLRIRERPKVNVGHIATGISEQILDRTFSLQKIDGQPVPHDQTVPSTGLRLRCVQAPNSSHSWSWRIRDGVLETRE